MGPIGWIPAHQPYRPGARPAGGESHCIARAIESRCSCFVPRPAIVPGTVCRRRTGSKTAYYASMRGGVEIIVGGMFPLPIVAARARSGSLIIYHYCEWGRSAMGSPPQTGAALSCDLAAGGLISRRPAGGLSEHWNWCYLIGQVLQTSAHQFATLQQFFPTAKRHEWKEAVAGQRVQIIKPDKQHTGVLEFGTELVAAEDRSLVALLGASPGASTAAFIAIGVLQKCFAGQLTERAWLPKLKQIIPTYGIDLTRDADACRQTRAETAAMLKLENV
jgi:hypothetical protein